jgi:hypothetical protein
MTLFTGGLQREALTGLLAQQAAEQSCLADAVEERPRRELSGANCAVRNQLAENRQRIVIMAEEQVTGCLKGRRECRHVPRRRPADVARHHLPGMNRCAGTSA